MLIFCPVSCNFWRTLERYLLTESTCTPKSTASLLVSNPNTDK